jgi:hypothetical protein
MIHRFVLASFFPSLPSFVRYPNRYLVLSNLSISHLTTLSRSFILSCGHWLMYNSFVLSFGRSVVHSLTRLLARSLILHAFVCSFVRSFANSFILHAVTHFFSLAGLVVR